MTEANHGTQPHNAAQDSRLTAWFSVVIDRVADPLIDRVYGPIADANHTAGVVAVNATLTAPRLLEIPLAGVLSRSTETGSTTKGILAIAAKTALKGTDGLDGAVARATDTTTVFGAIGDPLVDMAGIASDNHVMFTQARNKGDRFTAGLAAGRSLLDLLVIAVSVSDYALDAKLKKQGIEVPEEKVAKAGAFGKLKFALSAAGNPMTQGSFLAKEGSLASKTLRAAGNTLNVLSIITGLVSVFQYRKRHAEKLKLLPAEPTN